MNYVLLGYMGSGKSAVGLGLSKVLQRPFIDLDARIEELENCSISDVFQNKGEIYFRKREAAILFELLETHQDIILATGGGTPCYGTVMDQLLAQADTKTIYLKHDVDSLTAHLFPEREKRPLIAHLESEELLNEFIRKHLFERGFYYNRAEWILDCSGLSVDEVVEQIVLQLF